MESERTIAVVEKMLGFAKLEKSELLSTVQCLHFIPDLDNEAVKLMEVDKATLEMIQENQRLSVRGGKGESAVLCTNNKTYDIKDAETSNQLLLLEDIKEPDDLKEDSENLIVTHKQVCAMKQTYLELRPMRPKLKKLHEILEENCYAGPDEIENEEEHPRNKYTFEDLQSVIQASDDEIKQELKKLDACLLGEHWRLLDFEYMGTILESILNLVKSESWSIDVVPMKTTCDILEDLHPRPIIAHVLQCHSETSENKENTNLDELSNDSCEYRLSEDKVCKYYAKLLLKQVDKFHLGDFEKSWQLCVPEEMRTSLQQLEGMALLDRDSSPNVVKYYPVGNLSEDVHERFDELFNEKKKWTKEEILPYIQDLATEKVTVSSLLMKNARPSTLNGIKVYGSKKIT